MCFFFKFNFFLYICDYRCGGSITNHVRGGIYSCRPPKLRVAWNVTGASHSWVTHSIRYALLLGLHPLGSKPMAKGDPSSYTATVKTSSPPPIGG